MCTDVPEVVGVNFYRVFFLSLLKISAQLHVFFVVFFCFFFVFFVVQKFSSCHDGLLSAG
jgi:hypothetical protein